VARYYDCAFKRPLPTEAERWRMNVTVDTNNLAPDEFARLHEAASGLDVEFAHVTVSDREMENFRPQIPPAQLPETAVWDESRWGKAVWGEGTTAPLPEDFVLDESRLDEAVLADESASDRFERLLTLISRGTFPSRGARANLSNGQKRQLRDAMIASAHIREHRDILITDDRRGFIGDDGSVREAIQAEFATRVMTADEFIAFCGSLR